MNSESLPLIKKSLNTKNQNKMIYTITLWAEDLNPYKPNREVSKFLIDCEHVRLHADGYTIDTPESRLTFPNNRVTVTEGDLT